MRLSLAVLALGLAAPALAPSARAQDVPPLAWAAGPQDAARTPSAFAERYGAALDAFHLPGSTPGVPQEGEEVVVALLPSLEGTWFRGVTDLRLDPAAPDADVLAQGCAQMGVTLRRTTARSFEILVPVGWGLEGHYAERFDYVTGNTFLRSFDEAGFLRRMLVGRAEDPERARARGEVLRAAPRGEALLFHPSPEFLVVVQPGRPADLWMRCS